MDSKNCHTDPCTKDCEFYEYECCTHDEYKKLECVNKSPNALCGHKVCCDGKLQYCQEKLRGYCDSKCMDASLGDQSKEMVDLLHKISSQQMEMVHQMKKMVSLLSSLVPKKVD